MAWQVAFEKYLSEANYGPISRADFLGGYIAGLQWAERVAWGNSQKRTVIRKEIDRLQRKERA